MPGASFFTLLDDLSVLLDDIATLTKVAAKKTAGVLGDDLALNAQQVSGMAANRELPVVWAVAKGSLVNKAILVPAALLLSAVAPFAVTPLLMLGGLYLCFEGVEKLAHGLLHREAEDKQRLAALASELENPAVDPVALETDKIRGAIRTDFVLSAEIVVISLGSAAGSPFIIRLAVLVGIALLMTVGVYGLVAGIVKLDDLGLALSQKKWPLGGIGRGILGLAPTLMKGLSVAGTAAMFLVGGGILLHGIPGAEQVLHSLAAKAGPGLGSLLSGLLGALAGIVAGSVALALWTLALFVVRTIRGSKTRSAPPSEPPQTLASDDQKAPSEEQKHG